MKALFILLISFTTAIAGRAQNREFNYHVVVREGQHLFVKKPGQKKEVRKLPAGTILKPQTALITLGDGRATVRGEISQVTRVKADSTIYKKEDDTVTGIDTGSDYYANVTQAKDTLYLNFQLLTNAETRAQRQPGGPPVELNNRDGFTGGFDRKNTYFIKLHDRDAKRFAYRAREISALTIPFLYRPGYTKGDKKVYGQLSLDANLAGYYGFKFGTVTYRYRKYETLSPNKATFSVGPFLNISRVVLDSTNTRLATDRHNLYRSIASLSFGVAAIVDVYDFRVGLFGGKDFAVGSEQWDYDRRFWIGLGIGYKLALFPTK